MKKNIFKNKKLVYETAKLLSKKYKYGLIHERIFKNYVKSIARLLGIPREVVEKSIAAENYYRALLEDEKLAKKYLQQMLKKIWEGKEL